MDFVATKDEIKFLSSLYKSGKQQNCFDPVPQCAKRLYDSGLINAIATPDTAFGLVAPKYYISISDSGISYYLKIVKSRRKKVIEWVRYSITTAIAITALIVSIVSLSLQQSG